MEQDMIDRVAAAISKRYEVCGQELIVDARDLAVAAISAMRAPSKKMLDAMAKAMSPAKRPTPERVSVNKKHELRWRAAVDEALKPLTREQPEKF